MSSALFWAVTRRTLVVSYQRSGQPNYQLQLLYIPEREDPADIAAEPSNHAVTRISKFQLIERTELHIIFVICITFAQLGKIINCLLLVCTLLKIYLDLNKSTEIIK